MRLLFLFLATCSLSLYGSENDSTKGSWNIQARADYGFVIAHRPSILPLEQSHVKGFEFSLARTTYGKSSWENIFHFPDYGITMAFFDLGSPAYLGKGIAVYPFIDFPLGKTPSGRLHLRYGIGMGYVEKIFDPETNIKNAAIGSHINGIMHIDLHYEKILSLKSAMEIGIALTHFSNGSCSLPNLGMNIALMNLGFKHSFGEKIPYIKKPSELVNKTPQYHVYAGGFYKKISPPLGNTYGAVTLSAMRFKPVSLKSAWGIGADIFFDNSLSTRIERVEEKKPGALDNFRSGIYGAYHLSVGPIGIMLNMGYYIYSPWKGDGNIYHRICLRYYMEKMFFCLNLKTHYAKADNFEFGVGYRFIKKEIK